MRVSPSRNLSLRRNAIKKDTLDNAENHPLLIEDSESYPMIARVLREEGALFWISGSVAGSVSGPLVLAPGTRAGEAAEQRGDRYLWLRWLRHGTPRYLHRWPEPVVVAVGRPPRGEAALRNGGSGKRSKDLRSRCGLPHQTNLARFLRLIGRPRSSRVTS
ncbi:hypothetical protein HPB50_012859 [Hyalomma asiaticum]|uniref:Uncharacterized protein n=1 Tax=Hyalomma asiaticum TaxID=266040 RepID=A0ACB7THB9_HYAAI|nr:hypothetical protein HPB50_012859 [Hyalomma asiaticum]